MYIVVSPQNNVVYQSCEEIKRNALEDYTLLVKEWTFIPPSVGTVIEVDALPSDFQIIKYCYTTEKGFYLNPDYSEPTIPLVTDEQRDIVVDEIKNAVISGKENENGIL